MKITRAISCCVIGSLLLSTISAFAMDDWMYKSGMKRGIDYFNKGLYYEAKDELNWFCDSNWGALTSTQQQEALYYLNTSKNEINKLENMLTETQFNNGMRKGISYYNSGMYYEAKNEIQRFCDSNWGRMSVSQQQTALTYLNGAKNKIDELEAVNNYTYVSGYYVTPWELLYVVGCSEAISLRTQPSTSASRITYIPLYNEVSFLADMGNGFYKVSYDGKTGYVLASYLDYFRPSVSVSWEMVINCKVGISLRTTASTSADVIVTIPLGASVWVTPITKNGFRLINYGECIGWALDSYLTSDHCWH